MIFEVLVCHCGTVVEYWTHSPEIEGSNPVTRTERQKMAGKNRAVVEQRAEHKHAPF